MKPSLVLLTTVSLLAAAVLASSHLLAAPTSSAALAKQQSGFLQLPLAAPAGQMVLYGHIKKLTRNGSRFELSFDPAWFTSGATATARRCETPGPATYRTTTTSSKRVTGC
jgi:hypothetical protein